MIYGGISRQPRRHNVPRTTSVAKTTMDRNSAVGVGEDDLPSYRMSLTHHIEHMETYLNQRQSIQLNLPSEEETEKKEGVLKTIEYWFVGENLVETFYLNSPWLYRFIRFFMFYTTGILFYGTYEGWDFEDSVNFITQTMTTVGYGDITPTSDHTRMFTSFYAVAGILLVYSTLNDIVSFLVNIVRDRYQKVKRLNRLQVVVRSVLNVVMWGIILFVMPLIGAVIFGYIEGWDFRTAFYFSIITSTSIGYGDYVVTQSSAIWFNLIYILMTCSVTGIALNKISSFKRHLETAELKQILNEIEPSIELMDAIHKADPLKITEGEYVLHMLQLEGKVSYRQDIMRWSKRFREFDLDKDRYVTMRDVIAFTEKKEQQEAEKAKADAEEAEEDPDQQHGHSNQHVSDVEAGIIQEDRYMQQRGSNIPFQSGNGEERVSRVSSDHRSSAITSASSGTEGSRRMSGISGLSGLSAGSRVSAKHSRKKSILLQIAEETRTVMMETINPYYQPAQDNTTMNKHQSLSSSVVSEEKEKPPEEDSRQSASLLTRQIISPLRSALALRRAGSNYNSSQRDPREKQSQDEEMHEKEIELSDTSSGSRDDKNNMDRNSGDDDQQQEQQQQVGENGIIQDNVSHNETNAYYTADSAVDNPLHPTTNRK